MLSVFLECDLSALSELLRPCGIRGCYDMNFCVAALFEEVSLCFIMSTLDGDGEVTLSASWNGPEVNVKKSQPG